MGHGGRQGAHTATEWEPGGGSGVEVGMNAGEQGECGLMDSRQCGRAVMRSLAGGAGGGSVRRRFGKINTKRPGKGSVGAPTCLAMLRIGM